MLRIESEKARSCGEVVRSRNWIGGKCPLETEFRTVEVIAGKGSESPGMPCGLTVGENRPTDSRRVYRLTHQRPGVPPLHRLKMANPSIGLTFLEMEKPPVAFNVIHKGALMRPIHFGPSLGDDSPDLIRAVNRGGAEDDLPPTGNATSWRRNVIETILLEKFRTFYCGMVNCSVEHDMAITEERTSIWRHRPDMEPMLDSSPGPCVGEDQVGIAIIVPEWTGIDESLTGL